MNELGILALQAILHSTMFLLLGIALYLLARRFGPAVGASSAFASLVVAVAVTLLTFCPWPRWRLPAHPMEVARKPGARIGDTRTLIAPGQGTGMSDLVRSRPPSSVDGPTMPKIDGEAKSSIPWIEFVREMLVDMPRIERANRGRDWLAWLVWSILALLALGLARLAIGLWGVRMFRSMGDRIEERALIDLVEILRAEMRCLRSVELREVHELSTPATIGWRRPIILLPGDWRTWSESEQYAVLAHELAHVCRNDFLTGLLVQMSLTLHFYHPLAHWFAARFRLEQELAADAWSSGLSGGGQVYLTTLARLALERDRRGTSWPVRAFLPSRSTFVRRIEMLRDAKSIRHVPITWKFRAAAFGTLAVAGLLVAGIRAPIGESTALAQAEGTQIKQALETARPVPAPSNKRLALSFVPEEANLVFALKPAELLAYPEFKELFDRARGTEPFKSYLIVPPEEIDQLVVFANFGSEVNPNAIGPGFSYGLILHAGRSQDWPTLVGARIKEPESVQHEGETYIRWRNRPTEPCIYAPDPKTLVLAQQEAIRMMIEDREAQAPRHNWDEVWPKVEKCQAALAFETRWLRRYLGETRRSQSGNTQLLFGFTLETLSPLFEKARGYAAGVNLSPAFSLDISAYCGTEPNAKSVAETAQAILTLARNLERSMDRDLPATPREQRDAQRWLMTTFSSILDRANVTASAKTANLQTKADFGLSHWAKIIAPTIVSSQQGRMRVESVNHLKHIGLAFHNYQSANDHFPPPILYGGKSGKVPYSWRVALLPYLEQKKLYDQYNFDETWDGPNNSKLIDKMPAIYSYPLIDGSPSSKTHSSYYVLTGPHTALSMQDESNDMSGGGRGGRGGMMGGRVDVRSTASEKILTNPVFPSIAAITDGTSNTILAVEARRDIPWTKPEDLPLLYDPTRHLTSALPSLFGGYTTDGFNVLFCDGSVKYIKNSIAPTVLGALFTRDGGEVISRDSY